MLTTKSRYAVMGLVDIATREDQWPIKLSDISIRQNIPLNYLEQIFLKLKKADLVFSTKGPGGGYNLKTKPQEITIEHIIDAVEENLKMTRCSKDKNCRTNGINCETHDLWKGLSKHIRNYFARISIDDVISENINIASS